MARKKKDKTDVFKESPAYSFAPGQIRMPPDMTPSCFPQVDFTLPDSQPRQKPDINGASPQNPPEKGKEKPHYEGHRKRLRQRFLETGGKDMPDYEFLELLLFRSQPRKDTKPLAKALLAHFGSLAEILSVDIGRLQEVEGCGEAMAADLRIIGTVAARMLRSELPKRDIFTSWDKLIAYCRSVMAHEEREQFRVLFLDKKNGLIADKIMQTGTVDHTPVYPREVVKHALDFAASSIILVHNHPSGDPTPSRQDIAMTAKLREITVAMNINIYDHLIIGRNGYASFRELNLL